jgi:DNA-binding NarL/FixJ family response regulator
MENDFNSVKKPNIIIVDDHMIFRQGLTALISGQNIASVIGEASNGNEYLELLVTLKPDLVLMDIDMPHMNGMEATQKSLALLPDLKIIAFTMFSDEDYYYKMIDLGVRGFILKSSGIVELQSAMRQVMSGESYFSNELLRKIINRLGRKTKENESENIALTDRELEILQLICLGLNNEEIGQKLFISTKTVKRHKANLLEKTMCKNTPSLILYAIKNKLVTV